MKFNFKIQHSTRQMKDMSQIDLKFDSELNAFGLTDDFDESGFKNENLLITSDMVLSNIKEVQQNNNVMVSDSFSYIRFQYA